MLVPRKTIHLHDRLDRFLLHPLFGRFFLLAYFLVFFTPPSLSSATSSTAGSSPLLNRVPPLLAPAAEGFAAFSG